MNTDRITLRLALLLLLGACVPTPSGAAEAKAGAAAGAQAQSGPVSASSQSAAEATVSTTADEEARARMEKILARGAQVSASTRAKAEKRLAESRERVDRTATASGEARVADRLAAEFGVDATVLMSERTQFECGWGELMIAHTLAAGEGSDATVEDLFAMRADGAGWGRIAAGMGFRLGDVVSAVRSEAQVAGGSAKADGRVATMRPDKSAAADASARTAAGVGHAGASANVGAGVRASVPAVRVGH